MSCAAHSPRQPAALARGLSVSIALATWLCCGLCCGCGERAPASAGAPPTSPATSPAEVPWPQVLTGYDEGLVQALETTRAELRAAPDSAEAWTRMGLLYQAHALHELARDCYRQSVALDARDAQAWYRLAVTSTRTGEEQPALEAFARVHELAPDYAPAWRKCGRYLVELGDPGRARSFFERALALDPSDVSSRLGLIQVRLDEGDAAGALAALDELERIPPGNQALGHRLRGLALARLGRAAEAESELARGVGARPSGADPWLREMDAVKIGDLELGASATILRADRMLAAGRSANALRLLEDLAERAPEDGRVFKSLGRVYSHEGRWQEALAAWESAAKLESGDARVLVALAATRRELGDLDGCLEALLEVRALDPKLPDAYRLEADVLLQQARFESVLVCCARADAQGIELTELELAAGKAQLELGDDEAALANFVAALALDADSADAWAGRALALLELGRREQAAPAIARLAELDPEHPLLAVLRQELLQEGGR